MKISYDKDADAAYVYIKDEIKEGEVSKTVPVTDEIIVDFDANKKLLGLEILKASSFLPKVSLEKSESAVREKIPR